MKEIGVPQMQAYLETYDNIKNIKMSVSLAYKIAKITREVISAIEFYNDRYKEILEKYGEKDNQGLIVANEQGQVQIQPDKSEECARAVQELNCFTITTDVTLSLSDLEEEKFTPAELGALMAFME